MTGQIRRLYFAVGMIVFLLVALALLMAAFRSAPQPGHREKLDGVGAGRYGQPAKMKTTGAADLCTRVRPL